MKITHAIGFLVALALGALAVATLGQAHADPQRASDRQLTERLVRASEWQAEAAPAKALDRVTETVRDAQR
ncbi:MAG TPA: hypothetical protein VF331_13960 [Polyangiales bacterium]